MTRQVNIDFNGPKVFNTWSQTKPLWWLLWRTTRAGSFDDDDRKEFEACKAKYLIFFDHADEGKAKEFAIHILDRYAFFKAAKVSVYARDNEKTLVLLGRDDSYRDSIKRFAQVWGLALWGVKSATYVSEAEKQANAKWGTYLHRLARAFGDKP